MKIMHSHEFFLSEKHAFCLFMLGQQSLEEVHGHDFDEIVIVYEGSGFHIINDNVQFIYKGDFFFVSTTDTHSYISTNNLSVINVLIHKSRPFTFLSNINKLIARIEENNSLTNQYNISLSQDDLQKIITLSEVINSRQDDDFNDIYFSATEMALFGIIDTLYQCTQRRATRQSHDASGRKYLLNFLRYNYQRHIHWGELCDESGMAKRTMFRFIKDITGYTPGNFQQLFRLLKAQELLRTTDKTINEIAIICGFQNTIRFTESYKRRFRYPPSRERTLTR